MAIVKTHSRFCLRYARYHNWQFYWYNLQSYASVRSSRHPSSLTSFLLQLPTLSLTHIPHSLIHPRSHPVSHSLTHPPTFPPHLPTHSLTHLPTTFTHSLIHAFTHSLIHSITHSILTTMRETYTRYSKVEFPDSICAKALRPAGPVFVPLRLQNTSRSSHPPITEETYREREMDTERSRDRPILIQYLPH